MPVVEGHEEREREVRRRAADLLDRSADGRRPRAAGRHVAQPRPELREGVRHHVPGARQVGAARLGHVVGRVDAPDRRRDHDARRRQRPRAAAARRAVPGGHRADRPRQLARDGAAARARRSSASCVAAGIRVTLDERDERPGWKFAEWELRGVPLRLEIGPKDIEKSQVLLARRDTREKPSVPMDGPRRRASRELLDDDSAEPARARASQFRDEHTQRVDTYDDVQAGDGRAARLRDRAVVRRRPTARRRSRPTRRPRSATCRSTAPRRPARCVRCDNPAQPEAWFAKSY